MADPWLKLSTTLVTNPKVMSLPADVFKVWICCLVEARLFGSHGDLPPVPRLAFALHLTVDRLEGFLGVLVRHDLVETRGESYRVHDWDDWQRPYPSQKPEAVAARVRRHRAKAMGILGHTVTAVTSGNERNDVSLVTSNGNGSNDVTLVTDPESLVAQRFFEAGVVVHGVDVGALVSPVPPSLRISPGLVNKLKLPGEANHDEGRETGVQREKPGRRIPLDFAMSEGMLAYARGKGLTEAQAHEQLRSFKLHFEQTTKNPTSRNWEHRWKLSVDRAITDGRVRPDLAVQQTSVTLIAEPTPAEQSFADMMAWVHGVGALTREVEMIAVLLGGTEEVSAEPPTYPQWVAAWNEARGIADDGTA